jgi:hypothetical protein
LCVSRRKKNARKKKRFFTFQTPTSSSERENITTDLLNAVLETKRAVKDFICRKDTRQKEGQTKNIRREKWVFIIMV